MNQKKPVERENLKAKEVSLQLVGGRSFFVVPVPVVGAQKEEELYGRYFPTVGRSQWSRYPHYGPEHLVPQKVGVPQRKLQPMENPHRHRSFLQDCSPLGTPAQERWE